MSSDITVGTVGVQAQSTIAIKPTYLVYLIAKKMEKFISLDKPELLQGFIQMKGFFTTAGDDELKDISLILSETKKENYVEILVPSHRVYLIKNLYYKAK
jgi:hypothetical protein